MNNITFHTCKLCPYRCKSSFVFSKHESFHESRSNIELFACHTKSPAMYACEFCNFETNLKVDLTEHFRVFHEAKEELKYIFKCFRCQKCDFETHSVLVLKNHNDECNCRLTNVLLEHSYSKSSKQHIKWKSPHAGVIKWFKCKHCVFKSKYKCYVKQHVVLKHFKALKQREIIPNQQGNLKQNVQPEDIVWLYCGHCEYKCKVKRVLRQHILMVHTDPGDVKWFQCAQCEFKCKLSSSLQRHILAKHTDSKDIKWFQCEQCECKFKWKSTLKQHRLNKHVSLEDTKWFKCLQCEFKTRYRYYLNIHVKIKHVNSEVASWFQCELCEYKCKEEAYLKRHVLKHKDPKEIIWFQCEQCESKFKRKSTLKQHCLKKHVSHKDPKGTIWFQCGQCAYKSRCITYVRLHVKKFKHGDPTVINTFQSICNEFT